VNQTWTKYLPSFLQQKLEGRHALQKAVGNTGWLFADQVVRMGVGLFVSVWVARYLGPDQYGALSYVLAFVSLFSPLVTLGLDSIVVRDIVKEPNNKEEILGSAFALKLAGGSATLLLSGGLIFFLRPKDSLTHLLVWIIASGTVFQAFDAIDFWFQSQMQAKFTIYARNAACLFVALIKVILILSAAPLVAFAWAALAEIILGAIGLIVVYRIRGFALASWKANYQRAKGLLKDSWPLILSGFAIYVQARIDQVMLGEMIGNAEVGQYSVAMRLIEVFGFIPMIISISIAPTITEAKLIGEQFFYNRLLNLYRIMFILFLLTSLPIFFFSEHLVVVVFGAAYKEAGVLLSLFAVRLFFTNFGVAKNLFITNENLFRYSMITAGVGAIVNLILNYLLIPIYASVGAIWAMIISFFITIFLLDIFFYRVRKNFIIMIEAVLTPWRVKLE
jgi:O-antigen/teichoic acid export membrane protein